MWGIGSIEVRVSGQGTLFVSHPLVFTFCFTPCHHPMIIFDTSTPSLLSSVGLNLGKTPNPPISNSHTNEALSVNPLLAKSLKHILGWYKFKINQDTIFLKI